MGGRSSASGKLQNIATIPYENRKIIEDNVINKTYGGISISCYITNIYF